VRHVETEALALALEEPMRDLEQDAGAVACFRIGAGGGAMAEAAEHLERLLDDLPRLVTANVGDEPYAARVADRIGVMEAPWLHCGTI